MGHSAGALIAELVVAIRSHAFGLQLYSREFWSWRHRLAQQSLLGTIFSHPRQCLVRRTVLPNYVSGRAQIGAGAALGGGRKRWRQCVAEIPAHYAADDA